MIKDKKILLSYLYTFIVIFLYSYVFFSNIIISIIISAFISLKFYEVIYEFLDKMDLKSRRIMFREFLDIFNTNIISGHNFYDSIRKTSIEIKSIFDDNKYLIRYLDEFIIDIDNGNSLEISLKDFRDKLEMEEATIFIDSLIIGIETGINLSSITRISKNMLSENISLEFEIDTIVDNSKREFLIMTILPLIVLIMTNLTSNSELEILDYIIRVPIFAMFMLSFYFGNKIVNLEV